MTPTLGQEHTTHLRIGSFAKLIAASAKCFLIDLHVSNIEASRGNRRIDAQYEGDEATAELAARVRVLPVSLVIEEEAAWERLLAERTAAARSSRLSA